MLFVVIVLIVIAILFVVSNLFVVQQSRAYVIERLALTALPGAWVSISSSPSLSALPRSSL